ncbi:MAG TPA: Hsp20/alpha crystallin family protein [Nitrospiraceae bacterium]|nr:Hsp20/alpha crystallin family protein [Nitrospiraceae bacterium]
MADVIINRRQQESRLRGRRQRHAEAYERGVARDNPASLLSLTLRDLLAAKPSELMRRFTEGMGRLFEGTSISPMTVWSPSIAISEKDGHIKIRAELPGLSEDDVMVELTQDGLVISGERKRERGDRPEATYWSGRFCSLFMRTISIPDKAQVEKAKATFENEVLTVLVPVPRSGQ